MPHLIMHIDLDVSRPEQLVGLPECIGQRAKAAIREAVGLTSSVGIGPNRLIAKLALTRRSMPSGRSSVEEPFNGA